MRKGRSKLDEGEREDLAIVLGATLTLLALIIGFSFSMSIGRYDMRKNYEEAEANAIGTEYLRVTVLPAADAAKAQDLLRKYLDQRILFYTTRDSVRLAQIDSETARLQREMWSAVRDPSLTRATPAAALALAGMNDVLNSQGYTQAAWWNRLPIPAWGLMVAIAIACNLLFGFAVRQPLGHFLVLPLIISVCFLLIGDLDSPRGGLIRVYPQNLKSTASSINH